MNTVAPCNICGTPLKWFPPGVSKRTGMEYEGFWGCPNKKNHPVGQPAGYPQRPPQSAPQAPSGPSVAPQSRERSIAAQAAFKAACEVFQGSGVAVDRTVLLAVMADLLDAHDQYVAGTQKHYDSANARAQAMQQAYGDNPPPHTDDDIPF